MVAEAKHGADGVDAPVAGEGHEARPLAGARIADVEERADERRILVAAGQGSNHTVTGDEDEVLGGRGLAEHELAPGEALVIRAARADRAQQKDDGEAPGVHLNGSP